MIAYLGEWIKQIVLLILVATFLDLLLPSNQMRRYIKLVVGLVIIMMILTPILDILQVDRERLAQEVDQLIERTEQPPNFDLPEDELEQWHDQAVLREVERMWAEEIKLDLEQRFDVSVQDVELKLSERDGQADVDHVQLVAFIRSGSSLQTEQDPIEEEHPSESESTMLIRPVVIDVSWSHREDVPSDSVQKEIWSQKLVTYFNEEWNISGDKIDILWTGG